MTLIQKLSMRQKVAEDMIEAMKKFQIRVNDDDAFIGRQITEVETALAKSKEPSAYKIAVVGSFKVGKSSFINRLLDIENLAPVNPNPETAVVTSFRHSLHTKAEIQFISYETWQEMKNLSEKDEDDQSAKRYTGWVKKINSLNQVEDKEENEKASEKYIIKGGYIHQVSCPNWGEQRSRKEFRKEMKKYISSSNPLHYLVERVAIDAPISILKDGIEIIDTPGLNDSDLYRVRAAEREINDVDSILFLTNSGASYSQTDKEFLLTQIRKRRLRQLRIIITKYDITYNSACRQAAEEDEDIPTLEDHFFKEELRVRGAISDTLNEILNVKDSSLSDEDTVYFHSLLDGIKIHFISSNVYTDGDYAKSGILKVREDLLDTFRNGETTNINIDTINSSIFRIAQATRSYIANYKAKKNLSLQQSREEKAYARTQQIAQVLLRKFERRMETEIHRGRAFDSFDREQIKVRIKMVGVRAQDVIDTYQLQDSMRHWRTKRNRDWVYLHEFSNKVANRIFPEFEATIRLYQRKYLNGLGIGVKQAELLRQEIQRFTSSDALVNAQMKELNNDLTSRLTFDDTELNVFFDAERHLVIESLENFIDDETYDLIDQSRSRVALVYGKGTNAMQNKAIADFYDDFSMIIRPRLEKYLFETFEKYTSVVADRVINIYKSITQEVEIRIIDQMEIIKDILERQKSDKPDVMVPAFDILENDLLLLQIEVQEELSEAS